MEAHADGRLTADEHEDRVERAYNARTLGELATLTTDLMPAEQQPIRIDSAPLTVAFGTVRRGGRWVIPMRLSAAALFGTVELDLREALLQRRHVTIDATLIGGSLHLLVPDGMRVEFTGRSVLGSRDLRHRASGEPDAPTVEIRGLVVLGSVHARAPKRRWRDRLRRAT
jgi:hypothetical protein